MIEDIRERLNQASHHKQLLNCLWFELKAEKGIYDIIRVIFKNNG